MTSALAAQFAMPHPIQARLDQLLNQWVAFADAPGARLLVWSARDDERGMIDAFVERECDPERAETPDLFLQLITPWTGQPGHGTRLVEELSAQAADAEVRWSPAREGEDIEALLSALASLQVQLEGRTLAVWLAPSELHDGRYLLWLQRLLHATPESIRFVAVGSGYGSLARAEPERVREVACALDMPSAFEELTDREGGATPQHVLRRVQARLNAQLVAGELTSARETAKHALALCATHGWLQLSAALQLIMGAALAARGQHVDAVAAYREAERHASHTQGTEGSKLRLLALLGAGGVLFGARTYGPASDAYLRAAALAAQLQDARSELESYRMAAQCSAELGEHERAWSHGVQGLCAAAKLSPVERETSGLPALGEHLRTLFAGDARVKTLNDQLTSLGG